MQQHSKRGQTGATIGELDARHETRKALRVANPLRLLSRLRRSSSGFTLIELMIVVAILGILAAVATVSFRKYALQAKTSEAYGLLGSIRMRQESYRSEFSQYCDVEAGTGAGATINNFWPTMLNGRAGQNWYQSGLPAAWTQLGLRPSGNNVAFQYAVTASLPGMAGAVATNLGYAQDDATWVAQARGDLDDDSTASTFEATSFTSRIFVTPSETE